jgi:beta-fructofuranosidase
MAESPLRVGFVTGGPLSDEQEAALAWLGERDGLETVVVGTDDAPAGVDVAWWHCDEPLDGGPPGAATSALSSLLGAGGGVLLTLRAMGAVTALGVESVPPDVTTVEAVPEPTGPLWRTLYDDHPAVAAFDSLRVPVCDRGESAVARYESVLPARGEVLAGTCRGGSDVPHEMSVAAWNAESGAVLGVGTPVLFGETATPGVAANRDQLMRGCLRGLAGGRQPSRPNTAVELRAVRERAVGDRRRPVYHFTPPANWLNDPNGLLRWNGRYHLFYQYNPAGPFHNTIHWGHAVSDDLVEWRDEPVALAPSPDGPDRDGCWSGCAVDDDGTATALYTGGHGRRQLPCLATAEDPTLRHWQKHRDNPVIDAPPPEVDVVETDHWEAEFRDHSVWREGDTWCQLIGTGVDGTGGAALLYSSGDLRDWRYEGPLLVGGEDGTVWECPELLDLGEKQLLHVSNYEDVVYFLGEVDAGEFRVDHRGLLDHGDFYAPQSLCDGDRSLTWGWLPEACDLDAQWDAGWSGALSLPRVLSLGPDGRLRQRPAEEMTALRERRLTGPESLVLDSERRGLDASGRALEVQLEVTLENATAFELSVFESPGGELTPIRYTSEGDLLVERSSSSQDPRATTDAQTMTVTPYDESLSLRVFLDGSVVELYANRRHCLTSRVYPTRPDSTGLSVRAEGGRARVESLSVWRLRPAVTAEATDTVSAESQ